MSKTYHIHTYGCQMNVADSELVESILIDQGYSNSNDPNTLNKLQNLDASKDYFLTLNPICKINENSVIKKVNFTHPYLNSKNTALQKDLRLIQGKKRTWFCGSYFGYGFHEDGLKSSIDLINNFKI